MITKLRETFNVEEVRAVIEPIVEIPELKTGRNMIFITSPHNVPALYGPPISDYDRVTNTYSPGYSGEWSLHEYFKGTHIERIYDLIVTEASQLGCAVGSAKVSFLAPGSLYDFHRTPTVRRWILPFECDELFIATDTMHRVNELGSIYEFDPKILYSVVNPSTSRAAYMMFETQT